mgnify:CR=1 FL=1
MRFASRRSSRRLRMVYVFDAVHRNENCIVACNNAENFVVGKFVDEFRCRTRTADFRSQDNQIARTLDRDNGVFEHIEIFVCSRRFFGLLRGVFIMSAVCGKGFDNTHILNVARNGRLRNIETFAAQIIDEFFLSVNVVFGNDVQNLELTICSGHNSHLILRCTLWCPTYSSFEVVFYKNRLRLSGRILPFLKIFRRLRLRLFQSYTYCCRQRKRRQNHL